MYQKLYMEIDQPIMILTLIHTYETVTLKLICHHIMARNIETDLKITLRIVTLPTAAPFTSIFANIYMYIFYTIYKDENSVMLFNLSF